MLVIEIPESEFWKPLTWISSYVGDRDMNYDDAKINGIRDMIDFFPIRLDLPIAMLGTNDYDYILDHESESVNMAYTPLAPESVSDFLQTTNRFNEYGSGRNEKADEATTYKVTPQGMTLNTGWLSENYLTGSAPVFVIEGRARGMGKRLTLTLRRKGVLVASWKMGLSVSPVKEMIRYQNVRKCDEYFSDHSKPNWFSSRRSKLGKWETDFGVPPNNPDGFFQKQGEPLKTLIVVHGVDWDHDETPAGQAEIFKRSFQAGSNARYIGVSWAADMSRRIGAPLAYGSDVIGAFISAKTIKSELSDHGFTGPNTTVLAHSLGNILVSSAIADHGLSVGNYVMLNAAVPVESYDGRSAITNRYTMVHPHWRISPNIYADRLMCAAWSALFSPGDPRSSLTWNNRFATVLSSTRVYQFYSPGEEVLRPSRGEIPDLGLLKKVLSVAINKLPFFDDVDLGDTVAAGEFVWVYNEMTKGQPGFFDQTFVDNHKNAGWRFNSEYDVQELTNNVNGDPYIVTVRMPASQAYYLATTNLIAKPFFDRYQDENDADIPNWRDAVKTLYTNDGANVTFPCVPLSTATTNQIKWHAKLLAEAIPPLSGPAGSIPVTRVEDVRRFNMMNAPFRDTTLWPKTRPKKTQNQQEHQRWLHGDYKDAPYLLTHGLYLKIAEIVQQ